MMPFIEGQGILFYSRDEEYGWLSNFWRSSQKVNLDTYMTNEHYYQSEKALNEADRTRIRDLPTPKEAMYAGRDLKDIKKDWSTLMIPTMYTGLVAKFTQNLTLKGQLLDTLNHEIHENSHHPFWGLHGQDHLGRLIMRVRTELKKGQI